MCPKTGGERLQLWDTGKDGICPGSPGALLWLPTVCPLTGGWAQSTPGRKTRSRNQSNIPTKCQQMGMQGSSQVLQPGCYKTQQGPLGQDRALLWSPGCSHALPKGHRKNKAFGAPASSLLPGLLILVGNPHPDPWKHTGGAVVASSTAGEITLASASPCVLKPPESGADR